MKLEVQLKQTQTLSPQMLQAMTILQMGTQELSEYIEEQLQENPVLESEAPQVERGDTSLLRSKLDWLASTDVQNQWYHTQDEDHEDTTVYGSSNPLEDGLVSHLRAQVPFELLSPTEGGLVSYLIESLDHRGWLEEEVAELAQRFAIAPSLAEDGISFLQSLEPPGVGARDLRECLSLQLLRRNQRGLPLTIVQHYLEYMGQNHYHHIAKVTGCTRTAVQDACTLIRTLNPNPSTGFSSREQLRYIVPDIIVVHAEEHFEVTSTNDTIPTLQVSQYYSQLYHETEDTQVKDYLNGKLKQAHQLMGNIEQRQTTLIRCAHCLVAWQGDFFHHGVGHLRPLLLSDMAKDLGVHESTVSRAIRDKYIQCAHGIFPMGYFFSRNLASDTAEEGLSAQSVKAQIQALIQGESEKKPLSDQAIVDALATMDMSISRRTVAKYRSELGIPSTAGRKKF